MNKIEIIRRIDILRSRININQFELKKLSEDKRRLMENIKNDLEEIRLWEDTIAKEEK
jgi:hypothetical protein